MPSNLSQLKMKSSPNLSLSKKDSMVAGQSLLSTATSTTSLSSSPSSSPSTSPSRKSRIGETSPSRPYSALGIRPQTALSHRDSQFRRSPEIESPRGHPIAGNKKHNNYQPGGSNVKVVVRVRPFLSREVKSNSSLLISMDHETQSTIISPPPLSLSSSSSSLNHNNTEGHHLKKNMDPRKFYFDHSLWSVDSNDSHYADQNCVYETIGKEFLDHNMEGYHTCIFAYGQTGSGKSYTMMGKDNDAGIIPRTCEDLFSRIEKLISNNVSCTVRLSYFEIYNECVRDLLAPTQQKREIHSLTTSSSSRGLGNNNITNTSSTGNKLRVRESPTDGPYVEGLSEYVVKSADQVLKYLNLGNKSRSTAATKMNDQSSRSHAVFTLTVKQVHFHSDTDTTEEKVSQIRLVDLAGSERANSTGATGERLREGSNINKSLTTLGRVIAALSVPSSNKPLVPYRDSILTWILKESLGGNSKTAMVACISPTDYEETLSTLRYADQAKRIRTRAIINHDIVSGADRDKLVEEMQQQINSLQLSLVRQEEDDHFKQELAKVKRAIRFYEDRAINEENKRRALQSENASIMRHNRLLTDHLKEVTNKQIGISSQGALDLNSYTTNYETLKDELSKLIGDVNNFKSDLIKSKENWTTRIAIL